MKITPQPNLALPSVNTPKPESAPNNPTTAAAVASETFRTPLTDRLRAAFNGMAETRPDALAAGMAMALDPAYPPLERINALAQLFVLDAGRAESE